MSNLLYFPVKTNSHPIGLNRIDHNIKINKKMLWGINMLYFLNGFIYRSNPQLSKHLR